MKQAIAEYEAAVKRQAGVRDQLDVQRHLLARLAGKGPDEGLKYFAQSRALIPTRLPVPEHLSMGLLVHRPDLAAALYRADSAARLVKVAKTQFYPTIDLTAFVGFNALTLTKGADKLAGTSWHTVHAYFMHEPTAPAYAKTLMAFGAPDPAAR